MSTSWKLFTMFGVDVKAHWSFLLIIPMILVFFGSAGIAGIALGILLYGLIFGSVVLHEFGHILTGRKFGYHTHDVILSPLGGMARMNLSAPPPKEEFWITAMGPAVNVGLLILGIPIYFLTSNTSGIFDLINQITLFFIYFNCIMVLFNVLPIYPMDGGRILRSFLKGTLKMNHIKATIIAVNVTNVLAIVVGILGVVVMHNFILPIIMLFIALSANAEKKTLQRFYG